MKTAIESIDLSNSVIPPGTIVAYGGTTPPSGWAICNGGTVSRTTNATLFAAIGTNFGSGDGSTTFHLPGFGQWKYGDDNKENFSKYKGYAFGVITLGLIGNLLNSESQKIESRNQYKNSYTLFLFIPNGTNVEILGFINQSNKFNDYEAAAENTKLAASALIGFYCINLIDSFLLGRYYSPSNKSKQASLFFYPTKSLANGTKEDIYSIGVQYQF
ncbi:MAG: phage tail protein [Leptospiraceae bacterium]|nr:phage tail protein [Leptospiraceae bacterium]